VPERARSQAMEGAKTLLAWESEPSTEGVLHRLMGELLEVKGDFAGAEKVYRSVP